MAEHQVEPFSGIGTMAEAIILALGLVLSRAVAHFPAIIWALRCPADSPHYTHPPPPPGLFRR